jgi:hypothetical protein
LDFLTETVVSRLRRSLLFSLLSQADALGYLLTAPPALCVVVLDIPLASEATLEFPVHATKPLWWGG